jgi:ribosome-associated protein
VDPDLKRCLDRAVEAALDKKSFQIVGLDVAAMTSLADIFLICSGASERQVGTIANEIVRRLKKEGRRPLHVEGEHQAQWVLIDYGDLVVHVFTEERRSFYALEKLWADARRLDVPLDGEPVGDRV